MDSFSNRFSIANKKEHPVELEWHYERLTKYGFEPIDKIGIGMVRSYRYQNKNGIVVECIIGVNSDRWTSSDGERGYWGELETYLKKLTNC